jgi:hypothetical protein
VRGHRAAPTAGSGRWAASTTDGGMTGLALAVGLAVSGDGEHGAEGSGAKSKFLNEWCIVQRMGERGG